MSKAFNLVIANKKAVPSTDLTEIRNQLTFLYPGVKMLECQPNSMQSVVSRAQQEGFCIVLVFNQFLAESEFKYQIVNLEKLRAKYISYPRPNQFSHSSLASTKQQLYSRISQLLSSNPTVQTSSHHPLGVVLLISTPQFNEQFRSLWANTTAYHSYIDFYEIPSLDQFVSSKVHQKWILLVNGPDLDRNKEALRIIDKNQRVVVLAFGEGRGYQPKERIARPEEIGSVIEKYIERPPRRSRRDEKVGGSHERRRSSLTKASVVFTDSRRTSKKQSKILPSKPMQTIQLYLLDSPNNPPYQQFYKKLVLPFTMVPNLHRQFSQHTKSVLIACYQDRLQVVKMLRVENKGALSVVFFNPTDEITQYVNHPCVDLSTNRLEELMAYFQNKKVKQERVQGQRMSTRDARKKTTLKMDGKVGENNGGSQIGEFQHQWVVKRSNSGQFVISRRKYINDNIRSITKALSASHSKQESPLTMSPPSSILNQLTHQQSPGSRHSIIMPSHFKQSRVKSSAISNNYNELDGNSFNANWLQQGSLRNGESMSHVNLAYSNRVVNMVADVAMKKVAQSHGGRVSLEEHMFPEEVKVLRDRVQNQRLEASAVTENSEKTNKTEKMPSETSFVARQYLQDLTNKAVNSHVSTITPNSLMTPPNQHRTSSQIMNQSGSSFLTYSISPSSQVHPTPYQANAPPSLSPISSNSRASATPIRSNKKYPTIKQQNQQEGSNKNSSERDTLNSLSTMQPIAIQSDIKVRATPEGSDIERKSSMQEVSELQAVSVMRSKEPEFGGSVVVGGNLKKSQFGNRDCSKEDSVISQKKPSIFDNFPEIAKVSSILTARSPSDICQQAPVNQPQPIIIQSSIITPSMQPLPSISITKPPLDSPYYTQKLIIPTIPHPSPANEHHRQSNPIYEQRRVSIVHEHPKSTLTPSSPKQVITMSPRMSGYEVRKVGGIEIYSWKGSSRDSGNTSTVLSNASSLVRMDNISSIVNQTQKSYLPLETTQSYMEPVRQHSIAIEPLKETTNYNLVNTSMSKSSKFKPTSISEVIGLAPAPMQRSRPAQTTSIKSKQKYESYYSKQALKPQKSRFAYGRLLSGLSNKRALSTSSNISNKSSSRSSKKLTLQNPQRPIPQPHHQPSPSTLVQPSHKSSLSGYHRPSHIRCSSQLKANPENQNTYIMFQLTNDYIYKEHKLFEDYPAKIVGFTNQASLERMLRKIGGGGGERDRVVFAVVDRGGMDMFAKADRELTEEIMFILVTDEFDTKPVLPCTKHLPQTDPKTTYQQITRHLRQTQLRMLQQPIFPQSLPSSCSSPNILNLYYKDPTPLSRIHNSLTRHYPGLYTWVRYTNLQQLLAKLTSNSERKADLVVMERGMVGDAQRIAETPRLTWLVMVVMGDGGGKGVGRGYGNQGLRLVRNDRELFQEIKDMFHRENCH